MKRQKQHGEKEKRKEKKKRKVEKIAPENTAQSNKKITRHFTDYISAAEV